MAKNNMNLFIRHLLILKISVKEPPNYLIFLIISYYHYKVNICKISLIRAITTYSNFGHLKWRIPDSILNADDKIKVSFVRGYFDGDGTVSNSIRFFSTNSKGLVQVLKILEDLKFNPYFEKPMIKENRKPLHVIHIRQNERERFLSLIKPVSKTPGNLRG